MGVDIVDLVAADARVFERHAHRALRPLPLRRRLGEVVGVARRTVAGDLGVDLRAAPPRPRERSRTSTPLPSPQTKPSRPRSNGRLAPSGSSFRRESASMASKPPMPTGEIVASAPPATITLARPRRIHSNASPRACAPLEHALVVQ